MCKDQITYQRKTEVTADGSNTLYIPEMDEHYHSIKGAETESRHIFLEMGFNQCKQDTIKVLEIGFGTGLNAYLTLRTAEEKQKKVNYYSIELYPLSWETVKALNYSEEADFRALHICEWNKQVAIKEKFHLYKWEVDFTKEDFVIGLKEKGPFDLIYFDAFAPEKQPEMWNDQLFKLLYVNMNKGGVLTTYCTKGMVRRMLQSVGFIVERLPGPPEGKREILRATKF